MERAFIRYQRQGDAAQSDFVADALWVLIPKKGIDVKAVDRDAEVRSLAQIDNLNTNHSEIGDYILEGLSNGVSAIFSEVPILNGDNIDTLYKRYILDGLAGQLG